MDEIKGILEMLKGASPWLVVTGGAVMVVWLWFKHKKDTREETEAGKLASQLRAVNTKTEEVKDMVALLEPRINTIESRVLDTCDQFRQHYADTDAHNRDFTAKLTESNDRFKEMITVLKKMHQELVGLNSSQPGKVINPENARLIIQYQWNWCRDECIRLLRTSIERNGIKSREDVVALRIFKAWKVAAKRAADSLTRFQGLQYQFTSLFDTYLGAAWQQCWAMALPLYHRVGISNEEQLEGALGYLDEQARVCFERILEDYFFKAEDLDNGSVYGGKRATSDEIPPVPESELKLLAFMSDSLRNFDPGSEHDSSIEHLKHIIHVELERRKKETDVFLKAKSEYQPNDLPSKPSSSVSHPTLKPQD